MDAKLDLKELQDFLQKYKEIFDKNLEEAHKRVYVWRYTTWCI